MGNTRVHEKRNKKGWYSSLQRLEYWGNDSWFDTLKSATNAYNECSLG